jgi:hypothetical protein
MSTDAPGAWMRLVAGLAVILSFGGFAFLDGALRSHPSGSLHTPRRSDVMTHEVTSRGETSTSVELSLGLLSDYYEHGIEHAPPRDPRGVMQRREDFYRPPIPPQELLRRKLGASLDDKRLRSLIDTWEAEWLGGHLGTGHLVDQLQRASDGSTLDAATLIEAAKGFQFLDSDELAAAFFRAALAKAESQCRFTPPGDPEVLPLLHALDQTKALWRLKDYPALERRFGLARRLYAPLSIESRRSGYLLADSLFYQGRFDEAADLILTVQAEHRRVGDLGLLDRSDIYEMNYEQGYLLFTAGRFESAIPSLKLVIGRGEHDQVAEQSLFRALLQTSRFDQARLCAKDLEIRFRLPPAAQEGFARDLEESVQQDQWRRQTFATTN